MKSKWTWILTGLTALLGASLAFADGIINDADTVRAQGGVGNYLFYDQYQNKDKVTRDTAMTNQDEWPSDAYYDSSSDDDDTAYYDDDSSDSLNLGASSAGRAR